MKSILLIISIGYLAHFSTAQQTNVDKLIPEFDRILSAEFKPDQPGATALVAKEGQIIYTKAIGMANLETTLPLQVDHVFRIGSITKQFTAVAILQLMEQGKLNLQDDITRFIPDYPTQGHTITIEHLLTHTSGIQSYTGMKDYFSRMHIDLKPTEMIDYFKNEPMKFAPGSQFNYNNSGYFLLGYIIEVITGQPYGKYLENQIFKPLGMTHSFYGSDDAITTERASGYSEGDQGKIPAAPLSMTQPYAAGSIQSTVSDLFKWQQALLSHTLISKESLEKAFTPYTLTDGTKTAYGYGWQFGFVQGSPTREHGGGINGFSTMGIYLPEEDVYVAVFANCDCISPGDIAASLAAVAIGRPYDQKAIPLDSTLLSRYTGVYENEKGEQRRITAEGNQLYSQRGRNPKFVIQAYQTDKFFFEDALLTIEFVSQATGDVDRLITHSRSGNDIWLKTDKPFDLPTGIQVAENILDLYLGEYEIEPSFTFIVTREQDRMFLQATGQDRLEIFARTESKFFVTVNDAEIEFVKDDTGNVVKALLNQGGRQTEAKKIK